MCEIGQTVFLFCKSVWIVMMGGNADDPGYHMLTVTDIMVYFDNCKKVGLNMNMGFQKTNNKKKQFVLLVQRGRIVHAFFKVGNLLFFFFFF